MAYHFKYLKFLFIINNFKRDRFFALYDVLHICMRFFALYDVLHICMRVFALYDVLHICTLRHINDDVA